MGILYSDGISLFAISHPIGIDLTDNAPIHRLRYRWSARRRAPWWKRRACRRAARG